MYLGQSTFEEASLDGVGRQSDRLAVGGGRLPVPAETAEEPAQRAEGERDLRLGGQRRVAAREDQPQLVVTHSRVLPRAGPLLVWRARARRNRRRGARLRHTAPAVSRLRAICETWISSVPA